MRNDINNAFNPEFPFVIAFTTMPKTTALMGGRRAATIEFGNRTERFLIQQGLTYRRRTLTKDIADAEWFILDEFTGFQLWLTVISDEEFAERSQFRAAFVSTPAYSQLTAEQRAGLRDLHAALTELFIAAEEVEDVNVTGRAD